MFNNNVYNLKRSPHKFQVSFTSVNPSILQEHVLSCYSIDSTHFDFRCNSLHFTYLTRLHDNSSFRVNMLHFSALCFNCTRKSNMNEWVARGLWIGGCD